MCNNIPLWEYFLLALVSFGSTYIAAYFHKKGENLATKEDLKQITKEVESIKSSLQSQLYIHQKRYEKEFDILFELSKLLVRLRDRAQLLSPELDGQNPKNEEVKEERLNKLREAGKEFYDTVESTMPFYPYEIYIALKEFEKTTLLHSIHFQYGDLDERGYWDKSEKNWQNIFNASNKLLEAIRIRINVWEAFKG